MTWHLTQSARARPHRWLVAICGLICNSALRADWVWPGDRAVAAATAAASQRVAVFTFHNAGTKPVTVRELMFACSCTKYSFTATTAQPGQDGELRIRLPADTRDVTLEVVAFGPTDTTPAPLTIQFAKPE